MSVLCSPNTIVKYKTQISTIDTQIEINKQLCIRNLKCIIKRLRSAKLIPEEFSDYDIYTIGGKRTFRNIDKEVYE